MTGAPQTVPSFDAKGLKDAWDGDLTATATAYSIKLAITQAIPGDERNHDITCQCHLASWDAKRLRDWLIKVLK